MYTERDMAEINGRIRKNWLALAPVLAVLLAAFIYGLRAGVRWVVMVAGPLIFVATCYALLAYLIPNMRYRSFLEAMRDGLNRQVRCTIVKVAGESEYQDGAWVLPVRVLPDSDEVRDQAAHASVLSERLRLEDAEDTDAERILYLNVSKRDLLPAPGAHAALRCSGRHIIGVE